VKLKINDEHDRSVSLFVGTVVCLFVCLSVCVCVSVVLGLEPTFDSASANVTVTAGETALLPCFITYLGKYKVRCAFLHAVPCRPVLNGVIMGDAVV